jgi:hypothetical protein
MTATVKIAKYNESGNILALYNALGAQEHNKGCSGDGDSEKYNTGQIIQAIRDLPNSAKEERDFLITILELVINDDVTIRFG